MKCRNRLTPISLATVTAVVMHLFGSPCAAAVISIDLAGSGDPMTSSQVAGVLPVQNWNHVASHAHLATSVSGSNLPLHDSENGATSARLSYYAGVSFRNAFEGPYSSGDKTMMNGWLGIRASDNGFITVSGLSGDFSAYGYNVLVYFDSNQKNNDGMVPRRHEIKLLSPRAESIFGWEDDQLNFVDRANPQFVQATGTTAALATLDSNYVVFEEVHGSSFTLNAGAHVGRAAITGIQIVSLPAPEPATFALLGMGGALLFLGRGRLTKRSRAA